MIITDGIHLTSDSSINELHQFAKDNNIPYRKYDGYKKGHPHYDVGHIDFLQFQKIAKGKFFYVSSREVLLAAKKIYASRKSK